MTCVFACALLSDETVDTYEWLLTTLLDAMDKKMPCSTLTDDDKAMRKVVKRIILEARHRLCSWHLECNVSTNAYAMSLTKVFVYYRGVSVVVMRLTYTGNNWCRNNNWEQRILMSRIIPMRAILFGNAGYRTM